MGLDQYSTFLSIAAALSLAGWVSQGTDSNVFPQLINEHGNYGYNYGSASRYHPYQQQPYHQHNWNQNQIHGVAPTNMLVGQQNRFYAQQYNYQSKDAEEHFRSAVELQELVSWQESYRRGDFNPGRQSDYILPVINKNVSSEEKYSTPSNPSSADDGYLSGDSSIHSPSSVFSGLSTNFDEASITGSENSPLVQQNDYQVDSVIGAVGGSEFDIDEILFGEKVNGNEIKEDFYEPMKTPFEKLRYRDVDLDFVNSPLKNPSFDEFLGSPNPGHHLPNSNLDNSLDDPFQMQFTNSSFIDNKALSNGIADLENIDPAVLDEVLSIDEEFDVDKALVASVSGKTENLYNDLRVSPYKPTITIKEEYPFVESPRHVLEHDYQKQIKKEFNNYISSKDLMKTVVPKNNEVDSLLNRGHRTYAPTSAGKNDNKKTKKQANKSTYIWSDFPYTYNELIEMPVETFNEIIRTLSDVRQHQAKDIRRKGKNKLAARNCRKRKLEIIDHLDAGVGSLEQQRASLYAERQRILDETNRLKKSTDWLNNYIFEHMRDSDGSPYSPHEYSLQYTSDGNVYLVPSEHSRSNTVNVK